MMDSTDSVEAKTVPVKKKSKTKRFFGRVLKIINRSKMVRFSTIRDTQTAIIDFIGYACFLSLVIQISEPNTHPLIYAFNRATYFQLMKKSVAEPGLISTYSSVNSLAKFWGFVYLTLLPYLEIGDFRPNDPASVYKDQAETDVFDEIYGDVRNRTVMHGNILLGPPRFRQVRVVKKKCDFYPQLNFTLDTCYGEYSVFDEDKSGYRDLKFVTMKEDGTLPIWSETLNVYLGAGYIQSLTYDSDINRELVLHLGDSEWINPGTRLVVIEFNVFHVNSRIFQSVKFIAEFLSSGVCVPSIEMISFPLYNFFNSPYVYVNIVNFLYYICIILATIRELILISELGFCKYIRYFTNFMDFLICLFSYLMIVLNVIYYKMVKKIMHSIRTENVYINLDRICLTFMIFNNILALIQLIAWIRLLIFMSFNRTLVILANVLRQSYNELLGYGLMCFGILMAYVQCGMALFGCNEYWYHSLGSAMVTMVRWLVCDFGHMDMMQKMNIINTTYYLSFMIVGYLILFFSFLGVVNSIYDEVKMNLVTRPSKLTLVLKLYIYKVYDFFYLIFRRKRKRRPKLDIDEMGEMESNQRIDPQHAAAMAAMRRQSKINPITMEPFEYLPGRLSRATKRVQTLEEVTTPLLRKLRSYYHQLSISE